MKREIYKGVMVGTLLIAVLFCACIKVFDKYGEARLEQQEQMRIEAEASPVTQPEPIETTFTPEPTYDFVGEIDGKEIKGNLIGNFEARAYCPCATCCGKETHLTANETEPIDGYTIAVDRNVIPLGTKVIVESPDGFGVFIADDTGNPNFVYGNHLEFYFDSHQDALEYGVHDVTVYTLEE